VIEIDGSLGEGGGQIVRTALGLSLVTGVPVRVRNVRARRERPGLRRQHLTAVQAAARIGDARVEGARLKSTELVFEPGVPAGGTYAFDVGTAGSATLVLQTILPGLLRAREPSRVTVRGGTHNPLAPPFEFLAEAFVPLLARMGAQLEVELPRHGFYPAGGGEVRLAVTPGALRPLDLLERGRIVRREARAIVANLPESIAERELATVRKLLGWSKRECRAETVDADGPGNALTLVAGSEHVTEVVSGFGEIGVPAETVARRAAREMQRHLKAGVPVGEHLADQLLIPLALAGGGRFRTRPLTPHFTTNAEVVQRFLPVRIASARESETAWRVLVEPIPEAAGS